MSKELRQIYYMLMLFRCVPITINKTLLLCFLSLVDELSVDLILVRVAELFDCQSVESAMIKETMSLNETNKNCLVALKKKSSEIQLTVLTLREL